MTRGCICTALRHRCGRREGLRSSEAAGLFIRYPPLWGGGICFSLFEFPKREKATKEKKKPKGDFDFPPLDSPFKNDQGLRALDPGDPAERSSVGRGGAKSAPESDRRELEVKRFQQRRAAPLLETPLGERVGTKCKKLGPRTSIFRGPRASGACVGEGRAKPAPERSRFAGTRG